MAVKPLNWKNESENTERFLRDRVVVGTAIIEVFGFPRDGKFWVEIFMTKKFKTRSFDVAKQDAQNFVRYALKDALTALDEWERDGNETI